MSRCDLVEFEEQLAQLHWQKRFRHRPRICRWSDAFERCDFHPVMGMIADAIADAMRGFFMLDRQIGDPLNQRFLPKLKPENFIKSGEVDVTEFKEEADGTIHRQVEWQRVI
ncbi:unnamed protein product [Durusdinium trenchii]|uniref:Uncharacterized protein n=1 Tax=Durusdinium trenchii TaxID=1381693 RepID=A0ABP0IQR7_9DINO